MNLRNNKITIGELLDYAPAQAALKKRFPMAMRQNLEGPARTMTLEQVLSVAKGYISPKRLEEALNELRRV